MITGGQAMFLNDAVFRNKKIKSIFHHHEQAAGMAAEAYGRITGKLGVAMVTAGPAAINVLNGVVGGYVDSSPMMVISGQSKLSCVEYMEKHPIRQFGVQGIYTRSLVAAATKYFQTIDDPLKILYYLEKAYYLATTGRPGPVWIEVPLDIQRMPVPDRILEEFRPPLPDEEDIEAKVKQICQFIYESRRPLLVVGQGVRIAKAQDLFYQLINKTRLPVVTARLGIDLIESDNKFFVGRPGLYGDRPSHFAIQSADLIISVAAKLDTPFVGYNPADWGRRAKKIVVDIDQEELDRPGIDFDLKLKSDAKRFLQELVSQINKNKLPDFSHWVDICNRWKRKYPVVLPEYKKEKPVNSYFFTDRLAAAADNNDMVVVDTSSPFHIVSQAWKVKKGQRYLTTGGISTMGYWPAAIGVCLANKKRRTIVITGDGCMQMNLQELATVKHNKLPIKIFIFNNNGYLLIRHTQAVHMEGRLFGESPKTGLWCPDSLKIAKAYGIKGVRINKVSEADRKIREVLNYKGPVICDVMTPHWQLVIPRISSEKLPDGTLVSKPYEDLYPFLDRDEFAKTQID
jgi:acetolactate synthase-1/2/3 large subunit